MIAEATTVVEISEIVRNWGIVVGGVIGIGLAWWRTVALNRQSVAQQQQAAIAQRGHITEVFKDAVEQLGNDKLEVRLGAVQTLLRIIDDFSEFESPILRLLTAYVREQSKGFEQDQQPTVDLIEIVNYIEQHHRGT